MPLLWDCHSAGERSGKVTTPRAIVGTLGVWRLGVRPSRAHRREGVLMPAMLTHDFFGQDAYGDAMQVVDLLTSDQRDADALAQNYA